MTVVVRTHGGLGNQLFQILYARLYARRRGTAYAEIHDRGYAHRFGRSAELAPAPAIASGWQQLVSRARLPKVLGRIGLDHSEMIALPGGAFLDGYFQRADQYAGFTPSAVATEIERLRAELQVDPAAAHDPRTLYHLRLGDFFNDREKALDHALGRIENLERGSLVISNQEELFSEPRIAAKMAEMECDLRPSADYSGEQVVRFMAGFSRIATNDSTLAFWASVLGNCRTSFENVRLAELHEMLFAIANAEFRG